MTGNRSSTVAGCAALVIPLLLQGCGGGGGGGEGAKVISETLVPDGPSGGTIQAEVDGGSEVLFPDGEGDSQTCLVGVDFHLFDADGNELDVNNLSSFFLLASGRRAEFRLRLCRGKTAPPEDLGELLGVDVLPGRDLLSLISGGDGCSTATRPLGVQEPLQEDSCQEISRVETHVTGCED